MKISLIIEGKTERVFVRVLRDYLHSKLAGRMPTLDPVPFDGRIPKGPELKRQVDLLLSGRRPSDHVIALTDVYTGAHPPEFIDAADAKRIMRQWVGGEPRFHPHAAQYEFEAWLLPYWPTIQRLARHNAAAPSGNPEHVNHDKPPSRRIKEIFERGRCRDSYVRTRDALRILRENDLAVAIQRCSELKAFVNTILQICGGGQIP